MPDVRSAVVQENNNVTWENRHMCVSQQYDVLYDIGNPQPPSDDTLVDDLKLTAAAIQKLMGDNPSTPLRGIGGGWSLSEAGMTPGRLINTKPMDAYFPLSEDSFVPAYAAANDITNVMYFQCGSSVQQVNQRLLKFGKALKTSGASNGQTLVGAISTGTHGSQMGYGAMQEYVVGIHILISPTKSVWLERASYPVVNDDFIAWLGCEAVRDDNMFNSAVVSFGSFGLIFGMLIETTPVYLLDSTCKRMPLDNTLRDTMKTLNFAGLALPNPAEVPFHFQVTINPHDIAGGAYVTAMYKRPYVLPYDPVNLGDGTAGPGEDLASIAGQLTTIPGLAPVVVNLLAGTALPVYHGIGTPGEIFSTTFTHAKGMSMELGLDISNTLTVLDIILSLPEVNSYTGFIGLRWVKQSGATLAFTKFPTTCTIEFPAAYNGDTTAFYNAIWNALEANNIPYTLHWGQMNNFTPDRVKKMYGAAFDTWLQCRQTLLDAAAQARFSNPFLESCGLA